jgi:FKBP-type peptidyl-prolyl cis-trans isomerase FkpA
MRKLLTVSVLAIFILGSCVKNDVKCNYTDSTVVAPQSEQQALQDSLTAHGISASMHPSGFFYTINSQGSGQAVSNLCTTVTVDYKGGFFNGAIFDSSSIGNPASFQLGGVVVGWQKGVPLISKGGDITLYIPPSLAYGPNAIKDNNGNTVIPANSYLVFNIHLIDVQ